MKISVITVCYNAVTTIEETILSVINQTYKDVEYIIIDGCSSDGTMTIVNKYAGNFSKVISEPDNGIYDAMNKGLGFATGDFVYFLGADDHLISYDVLEKVSEKIENYSSDTIFYGDVYRSTRNDIYCRSYSRMKLAVKNISHQALFYPRIVYKNYKYDLRYKVFADYAYNITLSSTIHFQYINVLVTYYNDTGTSAKTIDKDFQEDRKRLIVDNIGLIPYMYAEIYHFIRNIIKHKR